MKRELVSPGIYRITLNRRKNGKQDIIYEVLTDGAKTGGKRQRIRTRKDEHGSPLTTLALAKSERARILHEVSTHKFVHKRHTTVEDACQAWLSAKTGLKPSTRHLYEEWLAPLRQQLGHIELQRLEKSDITTFIDDLRTGNVPGYKAWAASRINGMLGRFYKLMEDARKQGHIHRNVVELVDRLPYEKPPLKVLSEAEMFKILDNPDRDRHVWALALYGLRRGELAGLRWEHINFAARTISITENRVMAGNETHVGTPKSSCDCLRRIWPYCATQKTA